MPSIRITAFRGLQPALSPKLLDNGQAQIAVNTQLWDGKLRPFPRPTIEGTLQFSSINSDMCFDPRIGIVPMFAANAINPVYDNQFNHTGPAYSEYGNNPTYRVFYVRSTDADAVLYVAENDLSFFPISRSNVVPDGPSVAITSVSAQNISPRPFERVYATTCVDVYGQEGLPTLSDKATVFEGDLVSLAISGQSGVLNGSRIKYVRLYRTVTEFETGEKIDQRHDTSFLLVDEIAASSINGTFTYIDNIQTDAIPGDLLLSKEFHPFPSQIGQAVGFGMLELGALAVATQRGFIAVSERYQYHAWPQAQILNLNGPIAAMSIDGDTIYVTMMRSGCAYRILCRATEAGLVLAVTTLPDAPNMAKFDHASQVVTSAGAMYPSEHGLHSLDASGATMVTRKMINPDQWVEDWLPTTAEWCDGLYLGHRGLAQTGAPMWIVDIEDKATGSYTFGNIVTLDFAPANLGQRVAFKYADDRLRFVVGNQLWAWRGLTRSSKSSGDNLTYRWRSKTYVYPAPLNFAAAKVVADANTGNATFRLIADGVVKHTEILTGTKVFRLPHLYRGIEFEIELEGTLHIAEVHISTSMTELREQSQ